VTIENLLLAFSNPAEGHKEEFNRWYDEVHVPELLAIPGVVSAQRFELPTPEGAPSPAHAYLAVYKLNRPGNEVLGELGARIGSGELHMSESLDAATATVAIWEAIGPERTLEA
jgi:hypothetical protein